MNLTDTIKSTPVNVVQSVRRDDIRVATSMRAGKIVPISYAPMLREDRVSRGQMRISINMEETPQLLKNAISVTAQVHYIPYLAFERFERGLASLNRSYMGQPETKGGQDVIPFFEHHNYTSSAEIYRALGIKWKEGEPVNTAVLEAYNALVNFKRRSRSNKLPERDKNTTSLARGFWKRNNLSHIVPDYDAAMIDGEVPLNVVNSQLQIRSPNYIYDGTQSPGVSSPASANNSLEADGSYIFGDLVAELAEGQMYLSLSNIEMAKKTVAWAKIRESYKGLEDDDIIDLLMMGIRVPDEQMSQPILLDSKSTIVGYSQRYASDAGNLDQSVTRGATMLDLNWRTPPMNTGGVILVTMEIVPEQLYENQRDTFMGLTDVEQLPNALRDDGDPEKVSYVKNEHVSVFHSDPDGTFGFAPLNHEWQRNVPRLGGKYYKPEGAIDTVDRGKFWTVEEQDPELTEHFYLVSDLPHKVFADHLGDPFEIEANGSMEVVGNTIFGKGLMESSDDYSAILDQIDDSRIDQDEDAPE